MHRRGCNWWKSRKAKNKEVHEVDGNGKGPADRVKSAAAVPEYEDVDIAEAVFRSIKTYEAERRRLDGPRRTLRARAAADGLRVEDVPGDGDCIFHSLARQLRVRYGVVPGG
eukprot:gene15455-36611_t